jgi:hypothetical protein
LQEWRKGDRDKTQPLPAPIRPHAFCDEVRIKDGEREHADDCPNRDLKPEFDDVDPARNHEQDASLQDQENQGLEECLQLYRDRRPIREYQAFTKLIAYHINTIDVKNWMQSAVADLARLPSFGVQPSGARCK